MCVCVCVKQVHADLIKQLQQVEMCVRAGEREKEGNRTHELEGTMLLKYYSHDTLQQVLLKIC